MTPSDLWTSTPIYGTELAEAADINPRIITAIDALTPADYSERSHFFGGRFENLYLPRGRIPEIDGLIEHAHGRAAALLGMTVEALRCGFWLNAQGPGQATSEHTHDENDELLSGVYYVETPPGSGDLVLLDGCLTLRVTPRPGLLLFFPPSLPHRVETNESDRRRLSIAFNFGPAD